ncbi:MAG: DUF655 domain-containing protein [Chroococcales cyanobacterium]
MLRRLSILVSLLFLSACNQAQSKVERPEPLPQDPFIQVYFNYNQAKDANYTEPYRNIERPGDNLEQVIIETINSAQSTIDVAVQEFRLPKIAQALAEKQKAGVNVRVILENTYNDSWADYTSEEIENLDPRERDRYSENFALIDINQDGKLSQAEISERDALLILRNAGIPILDDTADGSKGSGLMHHKFVLVDGATVIVSSANFTPSGVHGDILQPETRGNANNIVRVNNVSLAQLFTEEFNLMWGDGVGGKFDSKFGLQKPYRPAKKVIIGDTIATVQFSPTSPSQPWENSSNGLIGKTLKEATESIKLALFVFSEQPLANILATEKEESVNIAALIDPGFAFRHYSEGLDMLGVALANNCQYETDNLPWEKPISTVGIPKISSGDKLHHKFAVIDNQMVITGSHNWSQAANYNNDETVLVLKNPTVAAHFTREFDRLYTPAILGVPIAVQEKIQAQEKECSQITTPSSTDTLGIGINVNTASQEALETLPGIGPKLAQSIIQARQEKPFTSLEDLQRVSGIGESTIKNLEGRVSWD